MQTDLLQTGMGVLGSLGFAVLFGITEKRLLAWIAAGSGIGWMACLLAQSFGKSVYTGLLLSSLFASWYSEKLARVLKVPAICLLVPVLIPEIPGGDLYYAMSALVSGESQLFHERAEHVILETAAIVFGIVLVTFAETILRRRKAV